MRRVLLVFLLAPLAIIEPLPASAVEPQAPADKLFHPDHLIDVRIDVATEDWEKVRQQTRSLFKAFQNDSILQSPFSYVKGDVTIDGVLIKNVGIRKKGFLGSLDADRPSLKIRFDKYVDQAPFGDLDRLTLNNNKQDPSRLSQYLSYKLYRGSGTVASRCNFAKVAVNGEYLGIYSNVESMEPPLLKRGFGDGSGKLFEGTVVDLLSDSVHRLEPKTDDADPEELRPLIAILEAEELDAEKLESQLDVEAFIRFWAMESLIGFWDGYCHNQNNYFIYQNPANKKYYFMPWGTDSSFVFFVPPTIDPIRTKSVHYQSVLANRLYRDARFRRRYREMLESFLAKQWNEDELLAEIDRVEKLLKEDIHGGNSKFSGAVASVRSFIKGRRRVIEKELERWPIPLRKGPRQPAHAKELGRGTATFTTKWYGKTPSKPETRGVVKIDLSMDGEQVTFRQIGVTAEPSQDPNAETLNGQKPPTVVLTGIKESNGARLMLVMGLPHASFRPTKKAVGAIGVYIEGSMLAFLAKLIFNPKSITFIDGQVTFEQASMKPGSPVQGKLTFTILKFAGGASPSVRWEEP